MNDTDLSSRVACVDDVLITEELARRPSRAPDHAAENRAMAALAQRMATNPGGMLHELVELVVELCRADSAGVSILEPGGENGVLRWHAIAGAFAANLGGTMPRDASPCGTVMDRDRVLLFNGAERFFPALRRAEPRIHESLLAPWRAGGAAVGTLWAIKHAPEGRFDAEDARLLESLARFASAAHRVAAALAAAEVGRAELERRVEERTAALRESEARLRLVVENARDHAILVVDPEGRITDWLPGAEAVFGWTAEAAVGRPVAMIFTPEDREQGAPEWELETARRDGSAPNVRWHMCEDGSRVFIQGTMAAMRDARGELRGFLKIGQNVTERHAAEERLRRSEALFRTLATGIQALVFRGGPDGWRTWPSPQWVGFTGLGVEDSLGLGWLEAVHPEDREATLAAWREGAASGGYYAEHRIRHAAEGAWRWHQTRARPLDGAAGGEWVGAMTDVHDLRELQGRQGVLVAELQHRTRNLLAVVRALADKTMADAAGLDEFRDVFRDRLSALSRVQGLLSRLENGERVTFDGLVRAELAALGALGADGRGPQVVLDGPEGVRLRSGTVQTFALALHELATNAVKYGVLSRPEGRLLVRWRAEREESGEQRLHVDWRESGVAMPEAGAAPRGGGYGRELIERALPYQLLARTRYELGPDGVRCSIAVPIPAEGAEDAEHA